MEQMDQTKAIHTVARRYHKFSLFVMVAIALCVLVFMALHGNIPLDKPLAISVVFTLVLNSLYGTVWKHVALTSHRHLTVFYLGAMLVKLILGVLVALLYCLLVRDGLLIKRFISVFTIFYISSIVFDAIYFASIEKMNRLNK